MSQHEQLEVEGEDAREDRLRRLLQSQDKRGPSGRAPSTSTLLMPGAFVPADESASRLPDLLARLDEFLPQMAAANAELEQLEDPSSVNIEMQDLDHHSGPYIRLNLGLGVFEQQQPEQRRRGGSESSSSSSSSGSGSSSSSTTGSSSSLSSSTASGQEEEQDGTSESGTDEQSGDDSSDTEPDLFDFLLGQAAGVLPARTIRPLPRRNAQQQVEELQQQPPISVISSSAATDSGPDSAS